MTGLRPDDPPTISVIIPTYQRRQVVAAAVEALGRQVGAPPFEIIVVVDGSTDGTADHLRGLSIAVPLTVIEQANAGASSARNRGAAAAKAPILLFIDDDMEAVENLILAHLREHAQGHDVVLGHIPLHPDSPRNIMSQGVGAWAEQRCERLSRPGADLSLHDLLTGQISISRIAFDAVGGFDLRFTQNGTFGNEDIDFGLRLLDGGYDIAFCPEAVTYQNYVVSPASHLRQWRQAGAADVWFARKHPERGAEIFELNGAAEPFTRLVARPLASTWLWPLITWPIRTLALRAGKGESRLAAFWFFKARSLNYWRGVAEAGGAPDGQTLRILAYHAIEDLNGSVLSAYGTPIQRFEQQLADLTVAGFALISLEEFEAFLSGKAGLPRSAVLLTFDDCYVSLQQVTEPLARRQAGGLAFAISRRLANTWDLPLGAPQLPLLDAAGLRGLVDKGMEIGAHSRTHPMLTELAESALREEISGCADDLQAEGLPRPRYFAYPYGDADARIAEQVHAAGYLAAFLIEPGVMTRATDRMLIPRVEIFGQDAGWRLVAKVRFARLLGGIWPLKLRLEALPKRIVASARRRGLLPSRP